MKTKLLITLLVFSFSLIAVSQVNGSQIDDFDDGTTQLWSEGGASPNPPINIANGGPNGANDNYLQNDSNGGGGAGSKMVMFNSNIKWGGNYSSAGIVAITCDVRVSTNTLNLRVAMTGSGGRIASANSIDVAPSSNWTNIILPVTASDMALAGGTNIASTLANVTELRILSSTSPSWQGASIIARLEIDNIAAVTTLDANSFSDNEFSISPNPVNTFLEIIRPSNVEINEFKIFNLLGKQVYSSNIIAEKINVSNLPKGLYIIAISAEGNLKTQKMIKQ